MRNRGLKTVLCFLIYASSISSIACDFNLLLLHTNDMHSRYREVDENIARCQDPTSKTCYGGFARVRAAVDNFKEKAKKNKMSVLYLDAGDVFQETIYYMEYKGDLAAKMMNLLSPDATTLGNHEFDDDVQSLASYLRKLQVPIVCCNIDVTEEPDLKTETKILPSKVFEFGKTKIGVIGYLTQDIPPSHLAKVKILDEIESLRKEIKKLKTDNVNVIIALGHSGFEKDKEIAEKVEEVDVVVGGHSHAYLYSGNNPLEKNVRGEYPTIIQRKDNEGNIKNVPVVQAFYGTKYLGHLELVFDDEGNLKDHKGSLVQLKGKMKEDRKIVKELKPYSDEITTKYGRKVGQTDVLFQGGNNFCRFQECILGNLIADAFIDYANKNLVTTEGKKKIQIGLVVSKAIKQSLFPKSNGNMGDILLEDVMVVLPYGSSLEVLQIRGNILMQVLESSVNRYSPKKGGLKRAHLLQVSGLRVQFDLNKERGSRLTGVQVAPDYHALDEDATYNVVMTDYMANDNHVFPMLVGLPRVGSLSKDVKEYDVVAEYIEKHSPLKAENYKVEGRITINV